MRAPSALAAGCVLLCFAAGITSCSDDPDPGPALSQEVDPEDVCDVVGGSAVEGAFSADLPLIEGQSGPYSCVFESEDGLRRVTVRLHEAKDERAWDALAADVAASIGVEGAAEPATPLPSGVDAAASLATESDGSYALIARRGGAAVVVEATGFGDDRVAERSRALVEWIAPGLPDVAFDDSNQAGLPCDNIDRAALASAMGADVAELTVEPLPGVAGCSVSSEATTLTLQVYEPVPALTSDQMNALGRRRVVDGTEYVTEPQPVAGVGDAAVWVAEPQGGTSGDLYANWGTSALRVSASDPRGAPDQLRDAAISAGPVLAAAFVPGRS